MNGSVEPGLILTDEKELLNAIYDNNVLSKSGNPFSIGSRRYDVKSIWLCNLIAELEQIGYVYNSTAENEAIKRLGIDAGPEREIELTPIRKNLETLVYCAQAYYRHDKLIASGFSPLTQELIDEAFLKSKVLQSPGEVIIPVRRVGETIIAYPQGTRNRRYLPSSELYVKIVDKPKKVKKS